MTYLYVLLGALACFAAWNVIGVRKAVNAYAAIVVKAKTTTTTDQKPLGNNEQQP